MEKNRLTAMGMAVVVLLLASSWAKAQPAFIGDAAVYLRFEGSDAGVGSEPWQNNGNVGFGEDAFDVGDVAGVPTVTTTPDGVKGNAFDASMTANQQPANTYYWGRYGSGDELTTTLETGLALARSFTITGWIKVPQFVPLARIVRVGDVFDLQLRSEGRIEMSLYSGGGWGVWGNSGPATALTVDQWQFFAITYDGTQSIDNVAWYFGSRFATAAVSETDSYNQGQLGGGPNDAVLTVGNSSHEGNRPLTGYLDEIRIWASQEDASGVLSAAQIEEVRRFDVGATLVDQAVLYLPFDGVDAGIGSEPWKNKGVAGYNEDAVDVGVSVGAPTVTITSEPNDTLKGSGAFDASMIPNRTMANTYYWGRYTSGDENTTDLEEGLADAWSFTLTGWLKVPQLYPLARVIRIRTIIDIQMRSDGRIEMQLEEAGPWDNSGPGYLVTPDKWVFFAVTYDGTQSSDNVKWYFGDEDAAVQIQPLVDTFDNGQLQSSDDAVVVIGNAAHEANRPFTGYLDEIRIWASQTDASGVLSVQDLETVRRHDLTESCADVLDAGLGLSGDINGDCRVNLFDFSQLSQAWMNCNDPEDGNCTPTWP